MFHPALQHQRAERVYSCCLLVLHSILLLNNICFLHFDLCHISIYALRASRQISYGSLGSPSENRDFIIINIIIMIVGSLAYTSPSPYSLV